jgi:uncharacterized protein (TIGR03086 family)
MDLKKLYKKAQEQTDKFVKNVKAEDFGKQSTCSEWSVRDLLNHIVGENLWVPELLAGKTMEEVGTKYDGDVLGEDPGAAWEQSSMEAISAVEDLKDLDQVTHLSFGDFPASEYLKQMIVDITIHGWDVAKSTNQDDKLDEELAEKAFELFVPMAEEWRQGGALEEKVKVDEDASFQVKLLALSGRKS